MNYSNGTFTITGRVVAFNGNPVKLTSAETDYLLVLAQNAGTTVSREFILESLYVGKNAPLYDGGLIPEIKIVDVIMCKIRRKMQKVSGTASPINTVWGAGFNLPKSGKVAKAA